MKKLSWNASPRLCPKPEMRHEAGVALRQSRKSCPGARARSFGRSPRRSRRRRAWGSPGTLRRGAARAEMQSRPELHFAAIVGSCPGARA
eukprot:5203242-Alexandrium_andersonii.AAC.1